MDAGVGWLRAASLCVLPYGDSILRLRNIEVSRRALIDRYITETLLQSCRLPFESKFAVRLVDLVYRIMGQSENLCGN